MDLFVDKLVHEPFIISSIKAIQPTPTHIQSLKLLAIMVFQEELLLLRSDMGASILLEADVGGK